MSKQKQILCFLNEDGKFKEDIFVDVTIRHVPGSLVKEFAEKIVRGYPGGVSEAMKDLMRKAILNQDMKQEDAAALSMLDKQRAAEHG